MRTFDSLKLKRLYKCDNCYAIYEYKSRAEKCHYGDVVIYNVKMQRVKAYNKDERDKDGMDVRDDIKLREMIEAKIKELTHV